jgi:hypothetical protein
MIISVSHAELFEDSTRAHAVLATTMPNGSPHVTRAWLNTGVIRILINAAQAPVKGTNVRKTPEVALLIADPTDNVTDLPIREQIVRFREQGALAHGGRLALDYEGLPGMTVDGNMRITFRLRPVQI